MHRTLAIAALAAAGFAAPVLADQYETIYVEEEVIDTTTTDLSLRIGIGGLVQPDYEGSDDYEIAPWPIVSLEYLRLPGLGEFGGRTVGFSIGPSFGFVGERDQFSDPALIGLGNVDAAFELGLKAAYEVDHWGAYAALRQGFGGHEGLVGEAALYGVWRPVDQFVLRVGPDVSYATSEYFDTYFSVTPTQSFLSGLPVYNAGSGFKSVGIQGLAVYSLTEKVDLHFRAGYDRLVSGAADSPIVTTAGSRDQFTAGMGISYRIDLDLFD
ncbi:MipA/OmpV family protein [Microbaculum marinum]